MSDDALMPCASIWLDSSRRKGGGGGKVVVGAGSLSICTTRLQTRQHLVPFVLMFRSLC